jgi:cation:H+ antiporter
MYFSEGDLILDSLSLPLLWVILAGLASTILISATQLTKNADIIAFKTGLGRSFVGVVLLATATSLPELATGVSSVLSIGGPGGADLAAGDAFGSNLFNLLIIGLLDLMWRKGPILSSLGSTPALVGVLSVIVISLGGLGILIHGNLSLATSWPVSPVSVVLIIVFVAALFAIFKEEQNSDSYQEHNIYASASLTRATLVYLTSALIVVVAAYFLAHTGNSLADEMGWEKSFMGTQFLALSTSLPELAASIAAIRIMAPELAITNLLGSNLFNMGFVLFLDDVAYTDGPLWGVVSPVHSITAVIAILMTTVVLVPVISKARVSFGRIVTLECVVLLALYAASSVLVFSIGSSAH